MINRVNALNFLFESVKNGSLLKLIIINFYFRAMTDPSNNSGTIECNIVSKIQRSAPRLKTSVYFWKFWSFFGLPFFWIFLAVIYFFLDLFLVVILLIVAGASYFITILPLKLTLKRKRPVHKCENVQQLTKIKGFSLPSGHTYNVTVFGLVLAVHFKGLIIYAIVITLILMVAISRLYLGAHFLSDVVLGFFIAIAVVALLFYVLFPAIQMLYREVLRSFTFTRNLIPKRILRFFFNLSYKDPNSF